MGPKEAPGQRGVRDAGKVEVGSRPRHRGHLGRIGVAQEGWEAVVATDVHDQVERATRPGAAQLRHVPDQEARSAAGLTSPVGRRLDGMGDEVDSDDVPPCSDM